MEIRIELKRSNSHGMDVGEFRRDMRMNQQVQGSGSASFGESRAIPIFLLTTLLISSVFYFLIIKSGHMGGGWGAYVAGLMWSPGFAALLTCKLLRRDLSGIGWRWGNTRYEVIGYLIPLGYSIVIYALVWLTGLGGVYNKSFVERITDSFGLGPIPAWASIALYFIFTGTFTVIRDFATVIGEEIGWRGFLVPELAKKHSFPATAIITGFINSRRAAGTKPALPLERQPIEGVTIVHSGADV